MPEAPGSAFRQMREEDQTRPGVYDFHCGDEPWAEKVAEYLRTGEAWEDHRPPKSITLLYCEDGGRGDVIGFANVVKRRVGYPEFLGGTKIPCILITYIAVAMAYQRQGHFRRMLNDLAEMCMVDGLAALYLLVDERNEGAIAAYQKIGFEFFRDIEPYFDESDGSRNLRMVLPLN